LLDEDQEQETLWIGIWTKCRTENWKC